MYIYIYIYVCRYMRVFPCKCVCVYMHGGYMTTNVSQDVVGF